MPAAPAAVIDVLNGLLEARESSIFRFIEEGSPHLSRAMASVRRPLHEMVRTSEQHGAELWELIESLGGMPVQRSIQVDEQYLSFLSLKFLLPKLVSEKKLTIQRYQNAIKALKPEAPAEVLEVLDRHLATHRSQLQVLEKATEQVLAEK